MRFHALMTLRDEADVLPQTINTLLEWANSVYFYDLGSTDGTWEIIQDFAARDKRITPFLHQPTVFTDGLRSILFDRYRERFADGDWIVKVDADEFHAVAPPVFVRERLKPAESMVYLQWYYFRLTTAEAAAYDLGEISLEEDRRRDIRARRRYYKISQYSEPRMFRYRPAMQWPAWNYWPYNAGLVARERIPILHYPHRDPAQMRARFRLRSAMMARKASAGDHWKQADWQEDLVDATSGQTVSVLRDGGKTGLASQTGIDSGPLFYWKPEETLPEMHLTNHLPVWPKRLAQRFTHAMLLPMLDRKRPVFDPGYQPEIISEMENIVISKAEHANPAASTGTTL